MRIRMCTAADIYDDAHARASEASRSCLSLLGFACSCLHFRLHMHAASRCSLCFKVFIVAGVCLHFKLTMRLLRPVVLPPLQAHGGSVVVFTSKSRAACACPILTPLQAMAHTRPMVSPLQTHYEACLTCAGLHFKLTVVRA